MSKKDVAMQMQMVCQSETMVQAAVGQVPVIYVGPVRFQTVNDVVKRLGPYFVMAVNFLRHGPIICPAVQMFISDIRDQQQNEILFSAMSELARAFATESTEITVTTKMVDPGGDSVILELSLEEK